MIAEPATGRDSWAQRIAALKNLPGMLLLIWEAAPGLVLVSLILRILAASTPVAILAISKKIIDAVVLASHGTAASNAMPLVVMELVLAALGLALSRAVDYCDVRLADEYTRNVSLRVMRHAAVMDLASFEDPVFYDKLERARVQATDRVSLLNVMGQMFQRTIVLLSLAAGVIFYSPWLFALLILCVLPAFAGESHFAFLSYSLAHKMTPMRRELDYLRTLGSSRDSAKEIKMFGLADYFLGRYTAISEGVIESNRHLTRRRLWWGIGLGALSSIGYYSGYGYLVWQALRGNVSVGTLTFLAGAIAGANVELRNMFSLFANIAEQSLFLTDLMEFLNQQPSIRSRPNPIPTPKPIRKGLEFRDVSFHYPGSSHLVLNDLNLTIGPSERIALVGTNGQGKTTLVKLLSRLYEPTSGSILLDGVDLRDYDVTELRKEIGIIFQDFFRYDMPVRENIAAGRVELIKNDPALWQAVKDSRAEEIVTRLPAKLEQMLGRRFEGGVDLSGGQWQRVALARAYLRDAQMLILDEPTAALDAVAEAEVFRSFTELTLDRIAILISHRFSTVRMADRIVVLANGQISEEGTHRELVAGGGRYARLFEMQAANYR